MTAKSAKWSRVPTPWDIAAFDGVHCGSKYRKALRLNWRCPSCGRSAHELIRWSFINGLTMRARYGDEHGMGWTTAIVTHHSHDNGKRFRETMMCGDCNSADGAVKRKLHLPESWSFSPSEIGQFVTVAPHSGRTIIDYEVAQMLYDELQVRP